MQSAPGGTQMMERVRGDIEMCQLHLQKTREQMREMSKHSNNLLSLFLCQGDREKEEKMKARMRTLGILGGQPQRSGEQPQQSQAAQAPSAAAQQDPAIIVIQPPPSPPPQSSSSSSSMPSLESYQNGQESDSDIKILDYIQPRRTGALTPKQENGPVDQIAAGTQNLLL